MLIETAIFFTTCYLYAVIYQWVEVIQNLKNKCENWTTYRVLSKSLKDNHKNSLDRGKKPCPWYCTIAKSNYLPNSHFTPPKLLNQSTLFANSPIKTRYVENLIGPRVHKNLAVFILCSCDFLKVEYTS